MVLRDRIKDIRLPRDLLPFGVDVNVSEYQETHFVCNVDARVLSSNFVLYSA